MAQETTEMQPPGVYRVHKLEEARNGDLVPGELVAIGTAEEVTKIARDQAGDWYWGVVVQLPDGRWDWGVGAPTDQARW